MIGLLLALAALFALGVGAIALFAMTRTRAARVPEGRSELIALAARAAADESRQALVLLLEALDAAPADCPVTVQWLHHRPANGAEGMLVKIAWDGNEWRRVYPIATLREQLEAAVPADRRMGRAGQLLAELAVLGA